MVTCVVTTGNACTPIIKSNTLTVTFIPPSISIPNTFTPNGDNINDLWKIAGLNSYYPNCEVSVYNRYCTLLYHSRGYGTAWNGKFNGSTLPSDTYYYIIKLNNGSRELSGPVAIIR